LGEDVGELYQIEQEIFFLCATEKITAITQTILTRSVRHSQNGQKENRNSVVPFKQSPAGRAIGGCFDLKIYSSGDGKYEQQSI
jgi:hypothetical protein